MNSRTTKLAAVMIAVAGLSTSAFADRFDDIVRQKQEGFQAAVKRAASTGVPQPMYVGGLPAQVPGLPNYTYAVMPNGIIGMVRIPGSPETVPKNCRLPDGRFVQCQ